MARRRRLASGALVDVLPARATDGLPLHLLAGVETARVKLQALDALTCVPIHLVEPARSTIAAAGALDEYTSNAANYLLLRLDGAYVPSTRTFTLRPPPSPAMRKQLSEPNI